MKPTLLLDVDGVIADCSTAVHEFAQKLLERELPKPETWTAWDHPEAMQLSPYETNEFEFWSKKDTFPWSIELYPGADKAVHALKQHYEVIFCTAPWAGNKHWVPARDKLLEPFGCDIIYTKAKHKILGDVMLDDAPHNIARGGPCRYYVLYDKPYNQSCAVGTHRIKELWELIGYAEKLK